MKPIVLVEAVNHAYIAIPVTNEFDTLRKIFLAFSQNDLLSIGENYIVFVVISKGFVADLLCEQSH